MNSPATNRIEKILQGISIETVEAEAMMYLAIYYRENDDYESAATYVTIDIAFSVTSISLWISTTHFSFSAVLFNILLDR
jgi:hypothetical protein